MAEDYMYYQLNNVTALYPKLDTTYKFDNKANGGKGGSIKCDPLDDNAAYTTSFVMPESQAKDLFKAMKVAYKNKKESSWPEKFALPFEKDEDGNYIGKAKLKGAYGTDIVPPPPHFDAKNNELPTGFQVTTDSVINLAVSFVPYNVKDNGVSLRVRGVQVIDLKPMKSRSPFGVVEGGFVSQADSPFDASPATPEVESDDDFDDFDSVEEKPSVDKEPKKVVKKSAPAPADDDDDISSIIDEWE